ncbi:MAG: UDP-N-acetylmuramate--L-alanine ligase [Planctomycetes bacterium]|nr:UDP-N-acetylmuramate--L-alanine ligase [Planctomycetota bacterium]
MQIQSKPDKQFDGERQFDGGRSLAGCRVHLVGIGGCGMSAAARFLLDSGSVVSGSDMKAFAGAGALVEAGATVHLFHDAQHLRDDVDLVVRSAAVPDSNPELVAATCKGKRVINYAELLGELTAKKTSVCIAGTHGKSTTTALTAYMMRVGGLEPSHVVGAESEQIGGSSGVGAGEHLVVESCEFDRSFLHLHPTSAAILNVEADHLDCFDDIDDIVEAFGSFVKRVPKSGLLVLNFEDDLSLRLAGAANCRVQTFGFTPGADWRATDLRADKGSFVFTLLHDGQVFTDCRVKLAGRYNLSNALAAAALAHDAGAEMNAIIEAMATFEGVERRMTCRGTWKGATVVDDYAHHPTEIKVTLDAVRCRYAPKRMWVVFQPHQASRTHQLMEGFGRAFSDADVVLVPDIFSVRDSDEDRSRTDSAQLVERLNHAGVDSRYMPSFEDVWAHLDNHVSDGDCVVTMGAGDVWKVADSLVNRV